MSLSRNTWHPACEDTCDALIAGTRLACLTCESRGGSGEEGARLACIPINRTYPTISSSHPRKLLRCWQTSLDVLSSTSGTKPVDYVRASFSEIGDLGAYHHAPRKKSNGPAAYGNINGLATLGARSLTARNCCDTLEHRSWSSRQRH